MLACPPKRRPHSYPRPTMSNDNDTLDPLPAAAAPEAPDADGDDGADDDGSDENEAAAGATPASGAGPAPVSGPPGTGRRRRRRRRRGRGAPVLFTPEGQAYRMLTGPDGQQNQVFLTPQELQQSAGTPAAATAAPAADSRQPGAGPRPPPGGRSSRQPQLSPVEGVLDTEVEGPERVPAADQANLLPRPEDPEMPKNLVQKLRLRAGPVPHRAGADARAARADPAGGHRGRRPAGAARRGCRTSTI